MAYFLKGLGREKKDRHMEKDGGGQAHFNEEKRGCVLGEG